MKKSLNVETLCRTAVYSKEFKSHPIFSSNELERGPDRLLHPVADDVA